MARRPVDESLFTTEPYITRREEPVLTYRDCPYDAALTFNAGVVRHNGEYIMLFRNDYGDYEKQILRGTHIGLARSNDGYHFTVDPEVRFSINDGEIGVYTTPESPIWTVKQSSVAPLIPVTVFAAVLP